MQHQRGKTPREMQHFQLREYEGSHPMACTMTVAIDEEHAPASKSLPGRLLLPLNTDSQLCAIASLPLATNKPMALARLLPLFHRTNWENPRESIGDPIGRYQKSRYQCWHPKGRALETYNALVPELNRYIETCPKSGTVILGMYMVGYREEDAAPRILICSPEERIRKTMRTMIKNSRILDKYPGFGLGDASKLPDRIPVPRQTAKEEIDKILPPDCDIKRDKVALIEGMEASAGKWIYTVNSDGRSLRAAATAGPFVFINDTWCQLTVSHPFFPSELWAPDKLEDPSTIDDDCDFDGMSDVDEEAELEATARASVSSFSVDEESFVDDWRCSPTDTDTQDDSYIEGEGEENSDAETCDTASDFRPSTPSNSLPTTVRDSFDGTDETRTQPAPAAAQQRDLNMSRLQYLGKLGLASDEFEESANFDYALIVINNGQIPQLTAPHYINPQLVIAKSFPVVDLAEETSPWKESVSTIGLESIDVVTLMPRAGPVSARLVPSPTFIRVAGKASFQKVYPLTLLDAAVAEGDSGSPVFDLSGKFCGHIVAGSQGTCHAYIVPATDIMADLESHVWATISLPKQAFMRVSKPIGTADYVSLPTTPDPSRTPTKTRPAAPQSPIATESSNTPESDATDEESTPKPTRNDCGPPQNNIINDTGIRVVNLNRQESLEEIKVYQTDETEFRALWEAARATSAAPSYFPPLLPDPNSPGLVYGGADLDLSEMDTDSATPRERPGPLVPPPPPHARETENEREAPINKEPPLKEDAPKVVHSVPTETRLMPPPHLRAKVTRTLDVVPPESITAALGQATLRVMKSLAVSTTHQPLFPAGLTLVMAEEELFDDLVKSRNDSDVVTPTRLSSSALDKPKRGRKSETLAKEWSALLLSSSFRRDAHEKREGRKQALRAKVPPVEEPNHHLHPDSHGHGHGVRDRFRSMTTKMGRHSSPASEERFKWARERNGSQNSVGRTKSRGSHELGHISANQDLGVLE